MDWLLCKRNQLLVHSPNSMEIAIVFSPPGNVGLLHNVVVLLGRRRWGEPQLVFNDSERGNECLLATTDEAVNH